MILSTANRQMKRLLALMKKTKERKKERAFVAEGIKMFKEAPKEWIRQVYVSESFMQDREHQALLADCPYEILSDAVFSSISDTQTPQGILAILQMPEYTFSQLLSGAKTHILLLESIQDPGNLGTMLRTAEAAGVTGVIMNQGTADLFNPKTIRATMGSIYRVPYLVTEDLPKAITALKENGVSVYAAHLEGAVEYDSLNYKTPTAFLIGNEGNGLSENTAALADARIRIPMEGEVESLNAAASAAVLMYECSRQRRSK